MAKKWKIIGEENVSPSKWFPIIRHEVKLASGKTIDDFFTAPFGNVAMVLPLTKENEIVFVKQYKHGVGEILIELPAGFKQLNKSIEKTALAELEEETGIKTTLKNLIPLGKFCNNPTKTKHITYGFLAKNLSFNSNQNLEITEEIELLKLSPKETLRMISSGEIWVADTVAFILKAQMLYPKLFK
ncbi:MAG: hydrolase [Bacteroidetes bacterium]|jgi:ADP-ribose pyrophosphatase YjhB (NUDIX family)|nr:hydrolase [Bacteroidota bacterium]